MTDYSYAQLEGLWISAGGSKALAPLMAAIAEAESGGNSRAYNASGATGLWQILGAVYAKDQGSLFDPQVNAREAVAKYKTQGLGAWTTYTSGAYKKYLKGKVPPSQSTPPPGSSQPGPSGNQQAQLTSFLGGSSGGVLADAGGLLHGAAVVIDRVFGMFAPGQGWRFVFGAGALVLALLSAKAFMGGGAVLPV